MLPSIGTLKWREALPRMLADLAIVHFSMIGALAISVVYHTALGHALAAAGLTSNFAHYYKTFFWFLSPVFPAVFLLNGFYTHKRRLRVARKLWLIARGVVLAVIIFFGVQVFFFGQSTEGRSVALPFAALASVGLVCARLLKGLAEEHFEVRPRNRLTVPNAKGRVLVIGGAGYIGSLLVRKLLENGYRVRALDSLLYGDEALRSLKDDPDFELIVGDCRNTQDVVRATRGVESIVHLAAIVGDPACDQNRELALETNYAATRMLIEIAKGHDVRRLLFASSCSVYGDAEAEVDENASVRPISLYGQTKVDSEQVLLEATTDNFHPTILRFATVFGLSYRPRFDLVVNLLTAKARQEGVITIYNGQQWRPFIHVQDLAEAAIRVLDTPARLASGEIFNVGDSRLNHTLTEVAGMIREVVPAVRIEHVENSDRRNYRVNFHKLSSRIGFEARYTLRDGIDELVRAFNEQRITDYRELRYHNQRYLQIAGVPEHKDEFDEMVMAAHASTFRLLKTEILLRNLRTKLEAAATPDECWEVLKRNYSEFGFQQIGFKMGDKINRHTTNVHAVGKSWTLRITLPENNYVDLSHEFGTAATLTSGRFSDVIGEVLSAKTALTLNSTRNARSLETQSLSPRDVAASFA